MFVPHRSNTVVAPPDAPQGIARQSFEIWKGVICALYAVGAASAFARLAYRVWQIRSAKRQVKKEVWMLSLVDDYLAFGAGCWGIVASVVMVLLYQEKDSHSDIPYQKHLYYVMSVAWTCAVWLPRTSLALSLCKDKGSHVQPTDTRITHLGFGLSLCFSALYLTHMAWTLATGCTHHARIMDDVRTLAYCNAEKQGVVEVGFVALFASAVALMASSAYALIISKRAPSQATIAAHAQSRTSYYIVLAMSTTLLLPTIVHCAFHYSPLVTGTDGLFVIDMTTQLEAAISIIACNVPVLVSLYRVVVRGEPNSSSTWDSNSPGVNSAGVSVVPDLKVPVTVLTLTEFIAESGEKDRHLGLGYEESDGSSTKSGRSL